MPSVGATCADWKSVGFTVAAAVGLGVWLALGSGWQQTLAAFLHGCYLTMLTVIWLIGFDAHSLTWRWGAVGEQWTAEELERLGPAWRVHHDIPDGEGNWDHIVLGPPGVFAIDSKNMYSPITIDDMGGRAGRIRFGGKASLGSAVRLKEEIERHAGVAVWVQAVVAVWGDLAEAVERDRVLYVPGPRISAALETRPRRLDEADQARIAAALDAIAAEHET